MAWSLFPEELAELGCPGSALETFRRLHRPWTWKDGAPDLGSGIRRWLEGVADLTLPRIVEGLGSSDGSTKLALELGDGKRIEAVHMPRKVRNPRVTYCISSQVGCAMGCTFCATGSMGILRNLQPGEIVGQVLALMAGLGPQRGHELTLVFMGMGEPLHNLDHLHRAIRLMCHPMGLGLGKGRITVSTSGLVSGIEKLAKLEPRPLLALSLNATTDEARSRTMPVNRVWNLARLRRALDDWGLRRGEKLTFEYVLIAGENDTEADAQRLADWLGDLRTGHNLNLIPLNEHAASSFREPGEDGVQRFSDWLKARGCFVTVRRSRGRDVQGACGQLVKEKG
ncbi:23S rRNA (adenine(2503)-C(2))-methyltransferase RlmN [Geothrix sp. 21YS21S-4]|uniref:23S rRNA (adenine(2503)-C(2))-methyltransferase RlmN n=1 Tax=Geothrix sp. 21YS21S-4 TaxID=3068889 RepID=UPI0027B9FD28|nr:23S rRNA (adenine(2503)-C(2))-methyltransferase RlmN [Geothrix sp. 21YS21S-4]